MALTNTSDPILVFNIVAGILIVFGVIFIRTDNQKGLVYKLGQ
jgi:hypothetical protein